MICKLIPQEFGSMLGPFDCEGISDFLQYYRGRHFGLRLTPQDAYITPAVVVTAARAGEIHLSTLQNDVETPLVTTFDDIVARGLFGSPLLGTFPDGPTYIYATIAGYRESAKGVNFGKLTFFLPDFNSSIFQVYVKSKLGSILRNIPK